MRRAATSVRHERAIVFCRSLRTHVRAYWASYASLLAAIVYTGTHFTLGVNATPSLPYTLCLIVKGEFTRAAAIWWPSAGKAADRIPRASSSASACADYQGTRSPPSGASSS